jgi:LmbE family N-acetylglucosaminyl deacetylase
VITLIAFEQLSEKMKGPGPVKRFVSDLQQNWNDRPFVWADGESVAGLKLRLPSHARVMVLAPHPDDPESAAITCRLLLDSGCDLHYAIVSMSPSGVEDQYAQTSLGPVYQSLAAKKIAIRKREQIMSAGMLGLTEDKISFFSLDDNERGTVSDSPENRDRISLLLESAGPGIVIMPAGKDTNRTHAWVQRVFRECAGQLARKAKRPMIALYNEDPKTTSMEPDLFVFFDRKAAEWKRGMLRIHDSQQQRNMRVRGVGFDERILAVNRRRYEWFAGPTDPGKCSPAYAEAFEMERFGFS